MRDSAPRLLSTGRDLFRTSNVDNVNLAGYRYLTVVNVYGITHEDANKALDLVKAEFGPDLYGAISLIGMDSVYIAIFSKV